MAIAGRWTITMHGNGRMTQEAAQAAADALPTDRHLTEATFTDNSGVSRNLEIGKTKVVETETPKVETREDSLDVTPKASPIDLGESKIPGSAPDGGTEESAASRRRAGR